MSPLIRKEIRLMLPSWVTAMILVLVPMFLIGQFHEPLSLFESLMPIGLILITVTSFGREFSLGTFSLMLVQPVSRRRFWGVKLAVLVMAIATVALTLALMFWLSPGPGPVDLAARAEAANLSVQAMMVKELLTDLVLLAVAVSGGLWTTLILQQMVGAFWFVGLVPVVIGGLVALPLEHFNVAHREVIIWGVLALYSVLGIWWSLRLLERAQDCPWTGGTVALPAWLFLQKRAPASAGPWPRHPIMALIRKEIQFQQISLAATAVLFVLYVGAAFGRSISHGDVNETMNVVMGVIFGLWLIVPLLVGCVSVAEERKLGTMAGQLCQPISIRVQFAIKLLSAVLLGGLLSAGLQWVAVCAGQALGAGGMKGSLEMLGWLCVGEVALALVAFFGSTLTRNIIHALLAGVVTVFVLWGIGMGLMNPWGRVPWSGWLPLYLGVPAFVLAVVWLAFANFKRLEVGWNVWRRNLAILAAVLVLVCTSTAAIYNRVWERFETLEPAHGPAQLSGAVRPKICQVWTNLFVLLPDGRLWSVNYRPTYVPTGKFDNGRPEMRLKRLDLGPGGFVGTNRWADLAIWNFYRVVGIQTNGSLWSLGRVVRITTNQLEFVAEAKQIGTDFDWKSAATGGGGSFLALKQNGTLWKLAGHHSKQPGDDLVVLTNVVQEGHDADWVRAFSTYGGLVGIKQDGSVWKWGDMSYGPNWSYRSGSAYQTNALRWNLEGVDINAYCYSGGFDVVLRSNGTAWASGHLPENFWGRHLGYELATNYVRIDTTGDWREVLARWWMVAVIKRDGSLWLQRGDRRGRRNDREDPREFSVHRDWLAMGFDPFDQFVALSADGTLSVWRDVDPDAGWGRLLGPSRKPVWNVNVFAENGSGMSR